ncbi:hypothetical protein DFH09DRAFT_1319031 [Mycena vulgaris]|nr:hypothetical protein DFH09DRAFT_1319031 [Mycena vulgaris]
MFVRCLSFLVPLVLKGVSGQAPPVKIQVGGTASSPGGTTQFTPNIVVAALGSIVTFQFTGFPGNHSVTQSSFNSPCDPLPGGFDSGWVSVTELLSPPPEWNLTITNDQQPLWFYCKQLVKAPHCNAGMVGVINVQESNKNFGVFQSAAKAATSVLPGQAEGPFVGIGASATGAPSLPDGALYFNPNLPVTVTTTVNGDLAGSTVIPSGSANAGTRAKRIGSVPLGWMVIAVCGILLFA